jgi:hypothetical protein
MFGEKKAPKWLCKGNKVKFMYNVTWDCEGTVESIDTTGFNIKVKMNNVLIDGEPTSSYVFHLPSIKQPRLQL